MPFGRQVLGNSIVLPTRVSFDGSPRYRAGGLTLSLPTLTAALSTDTVLTDGSTIKANMQYLRYGQILCRITQTETQSVTITGTPEGGTFTLTFNGQTTTALAYNCANSDIQSALVALSGIGLGNATVSGSGPFVVTFASALGNVPQMTATSSLTGGTSPAVAVATTYGGGEDNKFGPFDPTATDGRQTLSRGDCFILDQTYVINPMGSVMPPSNDVIGGVLDGGSIWLDRVIQSGADTHSLGAGPTLSEFLAAFPSVQVVKN